MCRTIESDQDPLMSCLSYIELLIILEYLQYYLLTENIIHDNYIET